MSWQPDAASSIFTHIPFVDFIYLAAKPAKLFAPFFTHETKQTDINQQKMINIFKCVLSPWFGDFYITVVIM